MRKPSYAHGTSSVRLLGETIGENLRRTVECFGDRDALVVRSQGYRATYRELWDQVTEIALGLLAHRVAKGDRVGIWSPNRFEWVVTQYAAARIGAILVNLNPACKTAEIAYALRQSGTSVLVHAKSFRQSDYVAMIREVGGTCPDLRLALVIDDDWERLRASARDVPQQVLADRERAVEFDDPVNIQYTSGTTGFPKGATLSHHNVLNDGYLVGEGIGMTEKDRLCIPCPSITASEWSWATSLARPTARRWSSRAKRSTRGSFSRPWRPSAARPSTACPRCSSASSSTRRRPASTTRSTSASARWGACTRTWK